MPNRASWCVLGAAAAAVVSAQVLLLAHVTGPGARGTPPPQLPAATADRLGCRRGAVLLVAAHPQCPCLPATLEQVLPLTTGADAPALRVLVMTPRRLPPEWDPAAATAVRAGLPPGSVVDDLDGELARQLGMLTTGHVLLYGDRGELLFDGGVTAGRGHRGDNTAARTLRARVADRRPLGDSPSVYGCPVQTDMAADVASCCRPD